MKDINKQMLVWAYKLFGRRDQKFNFISQVQDYEQRETFTF